MTVFEGMFSLHPRPTETPLPVQPTRWRDIEWDVVQVDPAAVGCAVFDVPFDDLVKAIEQMPGGYAEGDGSFGIVGPGGTWKVVGNFFESDGRVAFVQFLGHAPDHVWEALAMALKTDDDRCLVQFAEAGFFASLGQWRRQALDHHRIAGTRSDPAS